MTPLVFASAVGAAVGATVEPGAIVAVGSICNKGKEKQIKTKSEQQENRKNEKINK